MLPTMAIHERWSTLSALEVIVELPAAADSLLPIVQMSTLKSPKVKLSNGDSKPSSVPGSKAPKQVVYIRLRRNERANHVVLASAEKYTYAKAMLEPVLDHLSNMPSADFYRELDAWKKTVDVDLSRTKQSTAQGGTHTEDTQYETIGLANDANEDSGDENDSEASVLSILDPAKAIGTASLMDALEGASIDGLSDEDGDEAPPTQLAQVEQDVSKSKVP
ncbi:hypothetical protein ON010_g13049 [Phytophthora cinnamomi]|nr:hypothetical protein ON010_g13049 [Phytophthora cinnamomi]